MKLYEISEEFREIFDSLDDLCDTDSETKDEASELFREGVMQAWFESLDCIEEEFEDKAENVAAYIKSLKAETKELEAEEKSLKARRRQKERKIEYLTQYLLGNMRAIHRNKIDKPKAKISIRNNAESVAISDEKSFINWAQKEHDDLLRYKMPEISKNDVKKLLQSGEKIPYAQLTRTQSLIIK